QCRRQLNIKRFVETPRQTQAKREMMKIHFAHSAGATERDPASNEQPGFFSTKAVEKSFPPLLKVSGRRNVSFSLGFGCCKHPAFVSRRESAFIIKLAAMSRARTLRNNSHSAQSSCSGVGLMLSENSDGGG